MFVAACNTVFFLRTHLPDGIPAAAAAAAGALAGRRAADDAALAAEAAEYGLYMLFLHFIAILTQALISVTALTSDDHLAAWLCSMEDMSLWGTDNDPRNPPAPFANTGWGANAGWGANVGSGANAGWGTNVGWGTNAGWGGGGVWGAGGGWGNPPWRCQRWYPQHYGYRRMGAVFRVFRQRRPPHRHPRLCWVTSLELKYKFFTSNM